MDFDPRDYDSRNEDRFAAERGRSGGRGSHDRDHDDDWSNPRCGCTTRMTTDANWGVVRVPIAETMTRAMVGATGMTRDRPSAITMRVDLIHATCSCATSTCRGDMPARSSTTPEIADIRFGVLKAARSQLSVPSASCPRVTSATTMAARPIPGRATFAICENRDSSERSGWMVTVTTSSFLRTVAATS